MKNRLILSIIIFLLLGTGLCAEESLRLATPNSGPIFGLKLGHGVSSVGMGLKLHLFYSSNQQDYIKLGATIASSVFNKIESSGGTAYYPVGSYEVLFGHFYQTGLITTSTAIGLSCSSYESRSNVMSIPVEAELNFIPLSFIGIGLSAYANLNTYNSFYIISLNYSIGKLM